MMKIQNQVTVPCTGPMIKQKECIKELYTTSFDDTMLHTEVMTKDSVTEMLHFQASLFLSRTQDSVCSSSSLTFVLCSSWRLDMTEKYLYLQG